MKETGIGEVAGVKAAGVTVVVPVYNPGPYFERCLDSLLRQTLPRSRYELVFVDDGSTDGTGQRLDRAAAEYPDLVRVVHIENSGWPGRPRNLGTDLAAHKYVFYCDADDWLLPHALETLLGRAEADGSDLVVSRTIVNRRRAPKALFEQGDYCTDWRQTPGVFASLAIHKLFRREFLRERNLRFDEGKVRLEDFIFMTQAYLKADRISILGTRACYVFERRGDRRNLSATALEWAGYFRSVERIIDIVDANTAPGTEREIALQRVLRKQLVGTVSTRTYLGMDDDGRAEVFATVRRLLVDRIPPAAELRLGGRARRDATAIRRGERSLLEGWLPSEAAVTADIQLTGASWERGRLRLDLRLGFVRDGDVVRLDRIEDRLFLALPPGHESTGTVAANRVEVTPELAGTTVHVTLRSRDTSEEWRVGADASLRPGVETAEDAALCWSATALVEFATVAGGGSLGAGVWDLYVRLASCGWGQNQKFGAARADNVGEPLPAAVGALVVCPFWSKSGHLALDVGQRTRSLVGEVARRGIGPSTVRNGVLTVSLPLVLDEAIPRIGVQLRPAGGSGARAREVIGSITPSSPWSSRLNVVLPQVDRAEKWSVYLWCGVPGNLKARPLGLEIASPIRGPGILAGLPRQRRPAGRNTDMKNSWARRMLGSTTWQRRALRLVRLLGLRGTYIRPGTAFLSRSASYDVTALVPDQSYLVHRRRKARPGLVRLGDGLAVIATGDEPALLTRKRLGDHSWVVTAGQAAGDNLDVARIGSRGWLIARPDTSPMAQLTLEKQTMHHLGMRHVAWLLKRYDVDCVLDVGANKGQYAQGLRRNGYPGHIVSFEPVPEFVEALDELSADDEKWTVHQLALGSTEGTAPIRVQRTFSSLLPSSDYGKRRFVTLRDAAENEQVVDVPLRRLDTILDGLLAPVVRTDGERPRVFLKMDTQGFDLEVFRGLGERVHDVVGLQSEVALLLIYEQMPRMPEAVASYEAAGYEISGLYPVTREPDGRVIEYDCVMVRAGAFPG